MIRHKSYDIAVSKAKPRMEAAEVCFLHSYTQQWPVLVECAFHSVRSSNCFPHSHGAILDGYTARS